MSGFSGSPRLLKGVLVGVDKLFPVPSIVVFQYNPDTLTRTITPKSADGGDMAEATRLQGPPEEKISAEIEFDATDALEHAQFPAIPLGVNPALAALESLLYPKAAITIANLALAAAGMLEIIPPEGPLVVFAWGPGRIVPVKILSLTVTEEAFDILLNPIRAKVRLEMKVLTYNDLGITSPGGALYMVHHVAKEVLAAIGSVGNVVASINVTIG